MREDDWNAEAVAMAASIAQNLAEVPRGAIAGRQSRVSVVFGNDRGQDPPAMRQEVDRVRKTLDQAGIRILGFGQDREDGATWAMVVESEDLPWLIDLIGAS